MARSGLLGELGCGGLSCSERRDDVVCCGVFGGMEWCVLL